MPASRSPCLRRFKPRNLGFVELNGKRVYLGPWGAPETHARYHEELAKWEARGRVVEEPTPEDLCIVELVKRFMDHAKRHYRRPDGTLTGSAALFHLATDHLVRLYGRSPAAAFGPIALRNVRDAMVAHGLARPTCNQWVSLIRHVYRWGVAEELVPAGVLEALRALPPLQRGRTPAPEPPPVRPVPQAHVEKVLPFLSRPVAAMVRLQLLSGARPAEIARLRAIDLDTSGAVWSARIEEHKTSWRGRERTIYLGPQAQTIIKPFMAGRALDAPLFSPHEGAAEMKARGSHCHRRPNQIPTVRKTRRQIGEYYTTRAYGRAIERACRAANVPTWSPGQLRHSAATAIRKSFGLEAAAQVLGHASAELTDAVYAQRNEEAIRQVVLAIG